MRSGWWILAIAGCATETGKVSGDDDVPTEGDDDDDGGDDDDDDVTSPPTTETVPSDAPVWFGEVEPVVRDACVRCHQDGGIGPFVLDDYESARLWAEPMKDAVASGRMPPWLVRDDGTCSEWADSEVLAPEEVALIGAWADGGALEGDPAEAISDPVPPPRALDRVDLVLDTPEIVPVPSGSYGGNDAYRCYLFDDPTAADKFLTGFEVIPGNDAIVHHVLGMAVDPAGRGYDFRRNDVILADLEDDDPEVGWECFGTLGGTGKEEGVPVTWAPGMGAVEYPEGVGVRLGANDWFVVQIHYNLVDPAHQGEPDTTQIRLRLEDSVPKEAVFALPDDLLFSLFFGAPESLPPGEPAFEFTFDYTAAELARLFGDFPRGGDVEVYGVMPHMHGYGRSQTLTLVDARTGTRTCLADVPRWDYAWQKFYFFDQPVVAQSEDRFEISCTYDTTGAPGTVEAGWGTQDEMCLMVMMMVL